MRRSGSIWHLLKNVMRVLIVLMLFIALYSYAMFQGGFVSWFLFYSAIVLVILVCLYALVPLGGFQIRRDVGERAVPAQSTVTVTVTIRRKWPFPFLYLAVEDKLDRSLEKQMSKGHYKKIFYPSFKKELIYSYEISAIKRGEYFFYGAELETSDMFGLFHKRKYIGAKDTLLVVPNYYPIEKWSPYEKREAGTRLSPFDFIEELTSVAGAREYEPGDKLTRIDWKVTARSSKLMTKELEQEQGQHFLVILNQHVLERTRSSLASFEAAVELASSILVHSAEKQLGIGLWTIGENTKRFSPQASASHKNKLIRHLAKVQAEERTSSPLQLGELEENKTLQTTIVLLSTTITNELIEQVRFYALRRVKVFFILLDSDTLINERDQKRLEKIRGYGVQAYVLSEGNIDQTVSSFKGDYR